MQVVLPAVGQDHNKDQAQADQHQDREQLEYPE